MRQSISGGALVASRASVFAKILGSIPAPALERYCLQLLALCQSAVVILAGGAAKILYLDLALGQPHESFPYLVPAVLFAIALHYCYKQLGLQSIDALTGPTIGFGRIWAGLAIAFMALLGAMYLLKITEAYSRGWFLIWFVMSAGALIVVRWAFARGLHQLAARGYLSRHIGVLGTRECVEALKGEFDKAMPYVIVDGYFLSDSNSDDAADQEAIRRLLAAMQAGSFGKVAIALPAGEKDRIRRALRRLAPYAPEILLCTDLLSSPVPIHGSTVIGTRRADVVSPVPTSERYRLEKRLFDVAAAAIGLALLAPLLLLVALVIKLDSSGPVFFRQRRYGRNNSVFRIFKFRTMTVAEDGERVIQAMQNDPRVTRVGRFLRATSIDELPQLINVLLGEMSIVGPRPHALVHEERFEDNFDLFSRRRRVLPGITGWAQVNGYRGETKTPEDVKKRMDYDLYYIDNWSIWLDLEIVVRTFGAVLRGAH